MGTALAAKQDLLQLATREDLLAIKHDLQLLRQEVWRISLEQKFDRFRADFARDLAAFELRLTVKLGLIMLVGFSLMIATIYDLTH